MEMVSSLLSTAMESVIGVLLPDPNGGCALLPRLMDELDELKHLNTTDSLDFPGSAMSFTPPERCIWMKEIYENRPIGQIVWPATHNSATNKIGINFITRPFGQHQTLSIYYQLRYGVRALDIRVQQDGRVCNVNFLSYSMADVIKDIKKFMFETKYEIIILGIRTERGYTDPPDFESYLVHELGDLLMKQDDHVFSKTISKVLPGRIICIWKPNNSPKPSEGGPIWSASYLRGDVFETELPLTKFKANLINLSQQIPASERNYFYKVEHILMPQASSVVEWMLVWPRHAKVVSKRINEFARLFLSNCNSQDILDRLQIYSTDFINDDFIVACIALNHSMDIKEYQERIEMIMLKHRQEMGEVEKKFEEEKVLAAQQAARTREIQMYEIRDQQNKNALEKEHLQMMMQKDRQVLEVKVKNMEVQLETTKLKSIEIQRDLEELRTKFEDEKVQMEATKNSILIEKEWLMGELGDARKHVENMLQTRAKQDRDAQLEKDEVARRSEAQMRELRNQLQESKNALEDAKIKHAADQAKIQEEYIKETLFGGKISLWLDELSGKKCYMIAAEHLALDPWQFGGKISKSILSPETLYFAYLVFKFSTNHRNFQYFTYVGSRNGIIEMEPQGPPADVPKERKDGWMEIRLGDYFNDGGGQYDDKLILFLCTVDECELIVHGMEIRTKNWCRGATSAPCAEVALRQSPDVHFL